jgi:NADH-quinone oxidoreductase subunit C
MSQELNIWLDKLLSDLDKVEIKRKRSNRLRVDVDARALPAILELLQGRASYVHLSAITCVDWIDDKEFELVYNVWSYETKSLVSVHTRIPRDPGVYLSVYDLYTPAGFFERDIHEMFGVYFEGSPDMSKFILTDWNGPPPMRKEFDSEKFVEENFGWEDYRPQWLKDIEEEGGGITTSAEDAR